jgi:hypothetical protein
MRYISFLFGCFFLSTVLLAQPLVISGPMLGPVELRDAKVWVEVSPTVKTAVIRVAKKGEKISFDVPYRGELGLNFNPIFFTIGGLEPNTTYEVRRRADHQIALAMAHACARL